MLTKEGIWNKSLPRALSLGHRNIRNTLIYIDLENALFSGEKGEFYVKVAKTVEEDLQASRGRL